MRVNVLFPLTALVVASMGRPSERRQDASPPIYYTDYDDSDDYVIDDFRDYPPPPPHLPDYDGFELPPPPPHLPGSNWNNNDDYTDTESDVEYIGYLGIYDDDDETYYKPSHEEKPKKMPPGLPPITLHLAETQPPPLLALIQPLIPREYEEDAEAKVDEKQREGDVYPSPLETLARESESDYEDSEDDPVPMVDKRYENGPDRGMPNFPTVLPDCFPPNEVIEHVTAELKDVMGSRAAAMKFVMSLQYVESIDDIKNRVLDLGDEAELVGLILAKYMNQGWECQHEWTIEQEMAYLQTKIPMCKPPTDVRLFFYNVLHRILKNDQIAGRIFMLIERGLKTDSNFEKLKDEVLGLLEEDKKWKLLHVLYCLLEIGWDCAGEHNDAAPPSTPHCPSDSEVTESIHAAIKRILNDDERYAVFMNAYQKWSEETGGDGAPPDYVTDLLGDKKTAVFSAAGKILAESWECSNNETNPKHMPGCPAPPMVKERIYATVRDVVGNAELSNAFIQACKEWEAKHVPGKPPKHIMDMLGDKKKAVKEAVMQILMEGWECSSGNGTNPMPMDGCPPPPSVMSRVHDTIREIVGDAKLSEDFLQACKEWKEKHGPGEPPEHIMDMLGDKKDAVRKAVTMIFMEGWDCTVENTEPMSKPMPEPMPEPMPTAMHKPTCPMPMEVTNQINAAIRKALKDDELASAFIQACHEWMEKNGPGKPPKHIMDMLGDKEKDVKKAVQPIIRKGWACPTNPGSDDDVECVPEEEFRKKVYGIVKEIIKDETRYSAFEAAWKLWEQKHGFVEGPPPFSAFLALGEMKERVAEVLKPLYKKYLHCWINNKPRPMPPGDELYRKEEMMEKSTSDDEDKEEMMEGKDMEKEIENEMVEEKEQEMMENPTSGEVDKEEMEKNTTSENLDMMKKEEMTGP